MSETGPLISVAHLEADLPTGNIDDEIEHRTKTGRVVPLVDLKIVDPEMNELPRDGVAVGEIVLRAPWLTQAYLHNEDASEQLWAGGYLHTNDIANVDPRGYVQITDRIKDVIKTGGEWVSSLEVEDIISQCPGVREVAVVGVKDEKWGERPLAVVVREAQADETADEGKIADHMKAFLSKGIISKFAIPQQFKFVEQLPKTSVGKLDKKALRKTYGDQ